MSFNNTDYISDRIRVTNSYKETISLRDQIWSLSGKIELNKFLVLRDKIEKKLNEFDRPVFDDARVTVKFAGSDPLVIDPREVNIVVGKGQKLSDYVFERFQDAYDFDITYGSFEDPLDQVGSKEKDESKVELSSMFPPRSGSVRDGVQRIIKLALKLVNFLVTTYMKAFPGIAEELKFIKQRLEELFDKVSYY